MKTTSKTMKRDQYIVIAFSALIGCSIGTVLYVILLT